jgi:hypothetical protein
MYKDRTKNDWSFTDQVHQSLAMKRFYEPNKLGVVKATKYEDLSKGIDYWAKKIDSEHHCHNRVYAFQERFRKLSSYTKNSKEFTLRFERNNSLSQKQRFSEFYKIKARFFLYGILNTQEMNEDSDFLRYCVIDLDVLKKAIADNLISIDYNLDNKKNNAYVIGSKPVAIVKTNHEDKKGNSSFLVFNVQHILKLLPDLKIVTFESGYSNNTNLETTYLNKTI